MKSWTPPTVESIDQFAELAHKPENRSYFFTHLQNPEWVTPLQERGFFADLPSPYTDSETDSIRFPRWPEGIYLARMAPLAPDAVVTVLKSLGSTDNPIVIRYILETAGSLPDPHLQHISSQITNRLQSEEMDYAYKYVDEAVQFISRLIAVGKIDDGLTIARKLLKVRADSRHSETTTTTTINSYHTAPEPIGWLSEPKYEDTIEHLLEILIPQTYMEGFRLFASLLEEALRISVPSDEKSRIGEFSHIWRPAIGYSKLNHRDGLRGTLVSIVRDAAIQLSRHGVKELKDVVHELESRTMLHKRIALHILAMSEHGISLTEERIINKQLFEEPCVKHEYAVLLRQYFGGINPTARERVLKWISNGPDIEAYKQWREPWGDPPPSEADLKKYADSWKRDWYASISEYLDSETLKAYRQLISELGEPTHEDFLYETTSWVSWVGPRSPLTAEQLSQRSTQDVINYLRNWQPSEHQWLTDTVSIEGLARLLESDVQERTEEYIAISETFIDLDPTYVRHFFAGLQNMIQNGKVFSWEKPLKLAEIAVAQSFEWSEFNPSKGRDEGWYWCRHQIASLLESGLANRDDPISFALREKVWRLLEQLAVDPDPPRYFEPHNADQVGLSITTNPGIATHAIIEYAVWCCRAIGDLLMVPEARAVLEKRLGVGQQIDPSPVVHSIYGRELIRLTCLDKAWVVDYLDYIFPKSSESSSLRDAAWTAYLRFSQPHDDLFCILRSEYEDAIQRIAPRDGSSKPRKIDIELGNHLVIFYCRGVADYEIVDDYFQMAGDELTGSVMGSIGTDLKDVDGELDQSISKRIQDLWNERRVTVQHNVEDHTEEMRAFGRAFTSGKFDDDWALDFLEWAVGSVGRPGDGETVVEQLGELVSSFPARATRILAVMLEHPGNDWDLIEKMLWRDGAYALVEATAGISDPEVVDNRKRIADFYVKHDNGDPAFRDLIRSAGPAADG